VDNEKLQSITVFILLPPGPLSPTHLNIHHISCDKMVGAVVDQCVGVITNLECSTVNEVIHVCAV
jgi:hypothetical protein